MLCYDVMLCYVMLWYVMLCYVMLCYVMLCYVMLCYVMLCYVMICHDIYNHWNAALQSITYAYTYTSTHGSNSAQVVAMAHTCQQWRTQTCLSPSWLTTLEIVSMSLPTPDHTHTHTHIHTHTYIHTHIQTVEQRKNREQMRIVIIKKKDLFRFTRLKKVIDKKT